MKFKITVFFILVTVLLNAQQVTVLDRDTNFPIENVTIYNETNQKVLHTNKKGIVNLSVFSESDIISFNHLSYIEFEILKRELADINYTVYLTRKSEKLNEIILSASKGREKRSRIAEQVVTTSAEEIKKMAPQTSADLLANIPGVKVQKSQFGGGSPVLRGMEANRVLLVVDGVRMNNAIYRMGHLQNSITVSPNTIERTEVVFGPSSVIYGSDALGGVIHYYTKNPKTSEHNQINGSVYSRYSSVNNEVTTEGNIEIQNKKWASYTSISRSNFGDLKMGNNRKHGYQNWGKVFEYSNNTNSFYNPSPVSNENPEIQKNTGYNQTDVLQKLLFPLSNSSELVFNIQYSTSSNIDRFDKLTEYSGGNLKFAEWYYGPQNRFLLSSQLTINPNRKWLQKGTLTAAYQNIKESRIQRKFNSLDRYYRKENVNVYSLNGDFSVPLTSDEHRILSYGFELTHNIVNSAAFGKTLNISNNSIIGFSDTFTVQSRYPDGGSTYTSYASYISYRQDITKKATLNTGLRFIHTDLTAKWIDETFITLPKNNISIFNSSVTATVGYAYKPTETWQINSVLSSGFRSPNIDDIGKVREKSGNVTIPNIYLKPEYAYNAEIGALKYFNNRQFQIGLNMYYTLLNNYISRDYYEIDGEPTIIYDGEVRNIVANINKNNAYIVGSTLSFRGDVNNNWFTQGSATITKGRSYDSKQPLSSIPPLFGQLDVGYKKERYEVSVVWKFNAQKKVADYNIVEGIDNFDQTPFDEESGTFLGTPAWNTLNMNANCKINNSLTFYANLDNIFDIHYKEFASSISAPGRNVSISFLLNI